MLQLSQLGTPRSGQQAFFRYRPVGEKVVITNREGSFAILTKDEFGQYIRGEIGEGSSLGLALREANFLRTSFDPAKAHARLQRRMSFLGTGPNLHIFVVTLRCNETCIYCHSSRAPMGAVNTDMTPEIAEKAVDLALKSTNPYITIEFQGGEPLVNFPVVKHIIEYALERNQEIGKTLEFTLVSNLSLMTEEIFAFLMKRRVQVCTSIDGPQHLHDRQRKLPGLSAHAAATHWIKRINEGYAAQGLDTGVYHVEALLTTTRETLPLWKEVVDTYVSLGCRALFLRPLDPFGFAERARQRVEYPRSDFMAYYRNAVNYMIELNKQGVQILERFASIFLTKILGGEDPNYLDIRSPCGAGIGQVAYHYDGTIYTCDEGRMMHEAGDDAFLIGHVNSSTYRDLMGHGTVRAMALASQVTSLPQCTNCAYVPYCGVCPVHSYKTQHSIFARPPESGLCAVHQGVQDFLFEKLGEGDRETLAIFERWTTVRDRSHFFQAPVYPA